MKFAELAALKHLLETCENYQHSKDRQASIPDALKERSAIQTDQLRLNVAVGSWVRTRHASAEETIREIETMLDRAKHYDLLMDFARRIAKGDISKQAMMEFAQDVIATAEPPGL